jgi:predicted  nucleic acid-binding Zn-ribbon protein
MKVYSLSLFLLLNITFAKDFESLDQSGKNKREMILENEKRFLYLKGKVEHQESQLGKLEKQDEFLSKANWKQEKLALETKISGLRQEVESLSVKIEKLEKKLNEALED